MAAVRTGAQLLGRRNNKIVVTTGASAGVGRATAREFARNGEALDNARAGVESYGRRALAIPVDVSDADAPERAAFLIESKLGPIDIWVKMPALNTPQLDWCRARGAAPLLERHLSRTAYDAPLAQEPIEPDRRDNLWQTVPGDHGASGRFRKRASERSRELWLTTHRSLLLSACIVGAALAWLAAGRLSGR